MGTRKDRDYRLATVMFGGRNKDIVELREAVQYSLFSIRGQYRRFIKAPLTVVDGRITTPDKTNLVYRWDPDLTQQPVGNGAHSRRLASLYLGSEWEVERRALQAMDNFDFENRPYTGIFPVYVENTALHGLDRAEILRAVVHGLNGNLKFQYDLSAFPGVTEKLQQITYPFGDVDAFESSIQEVAAGHTEHVLESLVVQLVEQYSLLWSGHFKLVPAQWVNLIPESTLVFVEPNVPICFPAANPSQLRVRKGALDLTFGAPPKVGFADRKKAKTPTKK